MNTIYNNYTLEDMKFKNPVEVQTENVGTVIVEKGDEEISKKIDELATAAWKRDNETMAGWEYFADIAEACSVNFFVKSDDYGDDSEDVDNLEYTEEEDEWDGVETGDHPDTEAEWAARFGGTDKDFSFGSDELIDDYKD